MLPLYPAASVHFQTLMLLIALASILYGSVMAFTQSDARLIAGYSSVAQLGFITLGIFSLNPQGAQGALLQMVNHGLVVAPLFFIIALLAARAGGSEDIRDMGGIAFRAPVLAALFLIVALATLAMPGSSNFVGEFLILLGVFKAKLVIAIVAFTGVAGQRLRAAPLHPHDAQPRRPGGGVARDDGRRRPGARPDRRRDPVLRANNPQLALRRSEATVKGQIAAAQTIATPPQTASVANPLTGRTYVARYYPSSRLRLRQGDVVFPRGGFAPLLRLPGSLRSRPRPHVDFGGLSPLIALLAGATVVLMVGLARARCCASGWCRPWP